MIFRISLLCLCLKTLDTAKAELHPSLDQEGQQQLPANRDPANFSETMSEGSQEQQTQQRSLEQPCPLGELWEAVSNKCVPNSCDSPQACPEYDETCRYSRRFCYDQTKVCGQFVCDTACPQYERLDPVTMECIPVSCASLNACPNPDVTGRSCLRITNTDCEAGRPCPQFRCCPDISRCSSLYCAFGNVKDADGCPMCDCNACYGPFAAWGGPKGGGDYLVARKFLCWTCCVRRFLPAKYDLRREISDSSLSVCFIHSLPQREAGVESTMIQSP